MKVLNFHIPDKMRQALRLKAKEMSKANGERVTVAALIRMAVADYISKEAKQ